MSKKTIVKSISLEPTDEIEAFIKKQKNFSRTVRFLILQAIHQNGGEIKDVAEEYDRMMSLMLFEKMDRIIEDRYSPATKAPVAEDGDGEKTPHETGNSGMVEGEVK